MDQLGPASWSPRSSEEGRPADSSTPHGPRAALRGAWLPWAPWRGPCSDPGRGVTPASTATSSPPFHLEPPSLSEDLSLLWADMSRGNDLFLRTNCAPCWSPFCQLFLCNSSQPGLLFHSRPHCLRPNPCHLLPALFNIYKWAIYLFRGDFKKLPEWFVFMGEKKVRKYRWRERRKKRRKGKIAYFTAQVTSSFNALIFILLYI